MSRFVRRVKDRLLATRVGGLNLFRRSVGGALGVEGWMRSYLTKRPVDADGQPVPWFTYPATSFLDRRLEPGYRVFEYGAGGSTAWYAERVAEVTAVEHDPTWAEVVRSMTSKATVIDAGEGDYPGAIRGRGPFDVVVVDGIERAACARVCLGELDAAGVIVWDNAEYDDFPEAVAFLAEHGFRHVPFFGLGPVGIAPWTTAVLYRDGNCLGL